MNLTELIGKLERIASEEIPEAKRAALAVSGDIVQEKAKDLIGHYSDFPEWPQLAESTQEERARLGWTPNDPLLRSGELRESITHETIHDNMEVIGSTSEIMVCQEFGTKTIPPRPVLGPASILTGEEVSKIARKAVYEAIAGKPTGSWAKRGIKE